MTSFIHLIDRLTDALGRAVSILFFLMMISTCFVVLMRYIFQGGNIIFFQQTVSYMHAAAFLLGASWTLKHDGHVRVDILYRKMSPIGQAWVNALGTLIFLLPVSIFLLVTSFEFVARSWEIREISLDAGGIPYVYLLKTLIPAMCLLLVLQGIAELLRNSITLCIRPDTPANEAKADSVETAATTGSAL